MTKAPALPAIATLWSPVVCHFDRVENSGLRGWAFDSAAPHVPVELHLLIDGQEVAVLQCDQPCPDVVAAGLGPAEAGFEWRIPEYLIDGAPHRLAVRDQRRREVVIVVGAERAASLDFSLAPPIPMASCVDGLRNGSLEGWVVAGDATNPVLRGGHVVRVTCDGVTIGHVRANRYRGDVGRALNTAPDCGFQFTPPEHLRGGRVRSFGFFLQSNDIELVGSPLETSLASHADEARILELVESIDQMHRELTRIRRVVREMAPRPGHSVADYDRWFNAYEPALRRRVAARRPADGWASGPLVSVICPVFRTAPGDLRAAVASVVGQTYPNWELILLDDGSRDPALTRLLTELRATDSRIRLVSRRINKGIGAATNACLAEARGAWIAFFDHDDLLVSSALECMVAAAQETGARVLYSDEDKVEASGHVVDPAFKPDWNHRLLLGVNYVCHLLFVEKALLDALPQGKGGPIDPRYDGAQDHDLILRLSEHVPAQAIHHVPEILYHWRITAGSTAAATENKPYAVSAGVRAVSDHLTRLGRPATIEPMDGRTLYHVAWQVAEAPQVTVIIPFKDQIETTEQCLKALLATDYPAMDVILVDNWSTSPDLARLQAAVAASPRLRLLRIEEPFNYSRLNNLAAQETTAEFLVFMNNDLFVTSPGWLRAAVNEALVDPAVAAVGGKFLYPNGTVQHAGVVLGLGGVAGHVHVGLPAGDNGYAGRMLFAQEMSAVTAAGVLVRASAFRAVGGFDEVGLQVAFNDIDLCLKLRQAGYKVIWTPDFVADHHESLSRGNDERPVQEARFFDEIEVMKGRWGTALQQDPFYHPYLSRDRQAFFDLVDPE